MTEALDAPQSSGPPAAYFPTVGDSMVVGIVDVNEFHQRDYDTNEPKFWPDGGPVMGKVVTGLVVSTTGTTGKGTEKANQLVEPGDLVTFWCEGGKHYTWRDGVKAHGVVNVGDVMLWTREADEAPKNPRHNPRKVYTARLRKPEQRDGDLVERCVAERRALKATAVDRANEPEPFPATATQGPNF